MASESIFGINEIAAKLQTKRASLLASNLANTDTPGYQAQDIDFKEHLQRYQQSGSLHLSMARTNAQHLAGTDTLDSPRALYRVPQQQSPDGNTVEPDVEKVNFMKNSQGYMTSIEFMSSTVRTLRKAIKGGD